MAGPALGQACLLEQERHSSQAPKPTVHLTHMLRAQAEMEETMQSDNAETKVPPLSLDHVPESEPVTPPLSLITSSLPSLDIAGEKTLQREQVHP